MFRRNPWGHPWFLEGFTWLYLIWSLVPIAIAVLFSFNNGQVAGRLAGLLLALVLQGPGQLGPAQPGAARRGHPDRPAVRILTTIIAVPLGVAFALGINRWQRPGPGDASTS